MTALTRQNTLFVSEDWVRIYEALENVDFRAYDFDNLVQALMQYLRSNYPEEFNDWIASSEFVTRIEILAWLSQNISFRMDLNSRENFLATAERRDSLLRLAQNIGYKVNRVRSASGMLKIKTIRTNQELIDSNNTNLQNRTITWNDPRDEDWFERFIIIMNSALATRTRFGSPLTSIQRGGVRTDQYVMNALAPASGTFQFSAMSNGVTLPFDIYNARINPENGIIEELAPHGRNAMNLLYMLNGRGFGSSGTGFFMPIKQGNLTYDDDYFTSPEILRVVTLSATNVNNDDFFVQQIDESGRIVADWTKVDSTLGEGIAFNTISSNNQNIYEVDTLSGDRVRVRFGDGVFGRMPVGRFRFWYRTANPRPIQIRPSAIQNQTLTIPYTSNGDRYYLTISLSLEDTINNGSESETNFDIRTRAGKVFYTQNRMITAQDYNNFYLKDSTIRKTKTVNRTFAGQSRYARLNDPLSLYQNVKHVADDGRIYFDFIRKVNEHSADTSVLPLDTFISEHIEPLIRTPDKQDLYFHAYPETVLPNIDYEWVETSEAGGQSRGYITLKGVPQKVGKSTTGPLKAISTDSVIRFMSRHGPSILVDDVTGDGSGTDDIILKDKVLSGTRVFSVFPPMRNVFSNEERVELEGRIQKMLDFGIVWDKDNEEWCFVDGTKLDRNTSEFYLSEACNGNVEPDSVGSWMVMLEYLPNGNNPLWRVTHRGQSLFIESVEEVDFIMSNTDVVVDPENGRVIQDRISILPSNESRDSLRRRGIPDLSGTQWKTRAYTYIGDGATTKYSTDEVPLDPNTTIVTVGGNFQFHDVDFTLIPSVSGYSVCFVTPPGAGVEIVIQMDPNSRVAEPNVISFVSDGSRSYPLGVDEHVNAANMLVFIDGVLQKGSIDYGVNSLGEGTSITYNDAVPLDTDITVFFVSGIDNPIFTKSTFYSDGQQRSFFIPAVDQSEHTVIVSIDGIIQSPSFYTVRPSGDTTLVRLSFFPHRDAEIRIISVASIPRTRTSMYDFVGDGNQRWFTLDREPRLYPTGAGIVVTVNGVQQQGPWHDQGDWTIDGNKIFFHTAPPPNSRVQIFVLAGSVGMVCNFDTESEVGPHIQFLGKKLDFVPHDVIRHPDGYVNANGLAVHPADVDRDGTFDVPFVFKELVFQDGHTDLVLWRRVEEFGFNVWEPIGENTVPRGTYGNSATVGEPKRGGEIDVFRNNGGDIHYDSYKEEWLIANRETNRWDRAPNQADFKVRIGRGNLSFMWTHYAPEANRIDPSKSNIMNVYILTSGYDRAYRTWLATNGRPEDEPVPESSEQLRLQYQEFEKYRPISDGIIYYPGRYKPLFGHNAVDPLKATFKIIQTPGSRLSESDLKLRVLASVNDYFDVDRWQFGEKFYFTELVAFVHAQLAPDLQSMVIVPRDNDQPFGRLFHVRAEPDELFISSAGPDDVVVVKHLNDEELRINSI